MPAIIHHRIYGTDHVPKFIITVTYADGAREARSRREEDTSVPLVSHKSRTGELLARSQWIDHSHCPVRLTVGQILGVHDLSTTNVGGIKYECVPK